MQDGAIAERVDDPWHAGGVAVDVCFGIIGEDRGRAAATGGVVVTVRRSRHRNRALKESRSVTRRWSGGSPSRKRASGLWPVAARTRGLYSRSRPPHSPALTALTALTENYCPTSARCTILIP